MTESQIWSEFIRENPDCKGIDYNAWTYGGEDPDLLAELTKAGTKTATASAYPSYVYEKCDLPHIGEYNIILNCSGTAVCITKTTRVYITPFKQVSADHAYKEGEGDRSLKFWRETHKKIFSKELDEINGVFTEDMLVVCEEFELVYPI